MTAPEPTPRHADKLVGVFSTLAYVRGLGLALVLGATSLLFVSNLCNGECHDAAYALFLLGWRCALVGSPLAMLLALIAWILRKPAHATPLRQILAGVAFNAGLAVWSVWMLRISTFPRIDRPPCCLPLSTCNAGSMNTVTC